MQRGTSKWLTYALAVSAACAVTAACSAGGSSSPPPASSPQPTRSAAASGSGATTAPSDPAASAAGVTSGSPASACVTQVLGNLSLAQRVGQLFLVGVSGNIAGPQLTAAEGTYHFGSLLLNKTSAGTAALAGQTAAMQALASAHTGGVRFFIAANQEGGEIQQLTGPGFQPMPSALAQGTLPVTALRADAADWGADLRAAGVNLDLAPVMDVVPRATAGSNAPIGELDREFGYDPVTNGEHGAAFIKGMASAGVMTVGKHFPGLGRVAGNTDFTANVVDNVTTANDPYLNSYRYAISAGVPMMMVALATYTQMDSHELAAFSPTVIGLLRNGLGFSGVIVSDDLGQAAAVRSIPAATRAIDFLTAGGDLITSQTLAPADQMAAGVLAKASADASFRATVNAAAQRVLAAKRAAGLLPC